MSTPGPSIQATFRGIATFAAPTSLVTALLFYFGWARTHTQARLMGLDDSLFDYSTRDYILNSISSMYWPLFGGAVAVLVGALVHGGLSWWIGDGRRSRRALSGVVGAMAAAGLLVLVLGAAGAQDDRPSRLVSWGAPTAVTLGIVVVGYACYLGQRHLVERDLSAFAPLAWSMATALVLLSLFWTVSHYAGVRGVDLARQVEQVLPHQPDVTVYSPKDLHLRAPVTETKLAGEGTYRFEYSGLKLLFRSGGRLFLRPAGTGERRNIVIAESPELRFEFSRPLR